MTIKNIFCLFLWVLSTNLIGSDYPTTEDISLVETGFNSIKRFFKSKGGNVGQWERLSNMKDISNLNSIHFNDIYNVITIEDKLNNLIKDSDKNVTVDRLIKITSVLSIYIMNKHIVDGDNENNFLNESEK